MNILSSRTSRRVSLILDSLFTYSRRFAVGRYRLVEMMGFDSRRGLRVLVAVGSNSPPDCYSLPPLFESLDSHFKGIPLRYLLSHGGDDGIRTHDPLLAGQVLSQLSYTPILLGICFFSVLHTLCAW